MLNIGVISKFTVGLSLFESRGNLFANSVVLASTGTFSACGMKLPFDLLVTNDASGLVLPTRELPSPVRNETLRSLEVSDAKSILSTIILGVSGHLAKARCVAAVG